MTRSFMLVLVALAVVVTASANLLVNGDLEIRTGGSGLWGDTPANWWGGGSGGSEGWGTQSGTNAIGFWSWDNGAWANFGQDVYTNMILGDIVSFSIYGFAEADFRSTTSEMWLQLEVYTNGGSTYTIKLTNSVYSAMIGAPNTWNQYRLGYTNDIPNVNLIKPMVGGGGFTNRTGSQAVNWDNGDLTVVIPEPTIAALMGFGGLLFLAVRRMTRK